MQRFNRSAHTPVGTAFFLFVSLAIIPVSLRAAGLQVGFSPRLSAAVDIWRQVAQAFGPNYEAASGAELAAIIGSDAAPSLAAEVEASPAQEYACNREVEESSIFVPESTTVFVPAADAPRATCSKAAAHNQSKSKRVESEFTVVQISSNFEKSAPAIKALSAERAEVALRIEVLKILEKCSLSGSLPLSLSQSMDGNGSIKNPRIPKSFRMLVRFKQPAAASITGAQCKVRAVLAPAGRARLERASLNSPPATEDDCDL